MNYCDKCGIREEDSNGIFWKVFIQRKSDEFEENPHYDLCSKCKKELNKFMDQRFQTKVKKNETNR